MDLIRNSIEFHSAQCEDLNKKVNLFSDDIKNIVTLESKLIAIQNENRQLKQLINSNDQRERLLNLEIVGIPETANEHPTNIVINLAKLANVDIIPANIIFVNRITPKNKQHGRPRILIARLSSRLLKDNIISGARKLRLTTKDLGVSGEVKPVYVNDNLTPQNKLLLKKCKETAKIKEFQYVWTKHGKVYIRKNDTSPLIQILDEEDMKRKIA
ncbi:uncharacterized protein LOC131848526 [Achroia grisella]|nr:uncharacterized protein LOC131848526 [Achroia grisella]